MSRRPECVAHGRAAALASHPGSARTDSFSAEFVADTIADLLHYAVSMGLDADEVLEHGRRYYEGDLMGDLL